MPGVLPTSDGRLGTSQSHVLGRAHTHTHTHTHTQEQMCSTMPDLARELALYYWMTLHVQGKRANWLIAVMKEWDTLMGVTTVMMLG